MAQSTHVRIPKDAHEWLQELSDETGDDMSEIVGALVAMAHDVRVESRGESHPGEISYWEDADVVLMDADKLLEIRNL